MCTDADRSALRRRALARGGSRCPGRAGRVAPTGAGTPVPEGDVPMRNLVRALLCTAVLGVALAPAAGAGQNAGGSARIYWLESTGATAGLAARDASGPVVQGLVVATGLTNFRGADVQLVLNAFDQSGLP